MQIKMSVVFYIQYSMCCHTTIYILHACMKNICGAHGTCVETFAGYLSKEIGNIGKAWFVVVGT